MLQEPLITIDKFTGSGDGNLVYNEGFLPEIINGKSIMTSGLTSSTILGNGTLYGTLTLGNIVSILNLKKLDASQTKFLLARNNAGGIFSSSLIPNSSKIAKAKIHTIGSLYPDMFELEDNNIIYSAGDYLGYGLRGQATGGSTTTLIDTTKDFVTLGFAVNDKVTNLRTGYEYTITSITTTTSTNDTLNFSISGSLTNLDDDEYIVWDDARYNLLATITAKNWQGGVTVNWRRQIQQYGNEYMILNGNYIAKISADGTTSDDAYKQLPARNQALSFSVNNDKIIIASEYKTSGNLLLWDGISNGWTNILSVDFPIKAIVAYKSGWLFISRGTLYYTDGYQIKILSNFDNIADIDSFVSAYVEPEYFTGLFYYNGRLYFAGSYNDYNLIDYGVYCYDFKTGWTLIKQLSGGDVVVNSGIPYCVNYCNYITNVIVGGNGFINQIESHDIYRSSEISYSFIYYVNLPRNTQITGIGLNILRPIKKTLDDSVIKQSTIAVNIGDGNRGLIDRVYTEASGSGNNSLVKLAAAFYNNEVGDEIIVKDIASGNNLYGVRRYISAITNGGTTNEEWTVDTAFGSDLGVADIKTIKVKKLDKRTVYSNNLKEEVLFTGNTTGFLSDKLFIEVVVWNSYDYETMPISISSIKVYGN